MSRLPRAKRGGAQRGESNFLADMGIASPPAAARNVTVENFLPQQRWGRVEEFKFPEGKIHYLRTKDTVPAANRCTADLRSALLDQAEPGDTLFARALRSHFEPG